MKNWIYLTVAAVFAALLLASCWTVAPGVSEGKNSPVEVSEGVWNVSIHRDFYRPIQLKYALNEFVRSKGHTSYDAVQTKEPGFFIGNFYEYTVTMPGSTPVEDMKPKKKMYSIFNYL